MDVKGFHSGKWYVFDTKGFSIPFWGITMFSFTYVLIVCACFFLMGGGLAGAARHARRGRKVAPPQAGSGVPRSLPLCGGEFGEPPATHS